LQRIFNKADKIDRETGDGLCRAFGAIGISALDPSTFPALVQAMEEKLFHPRRASLPDPLPEAAAIAI